MDQVPRDPRTNVPGATQGESGEAAPAIAIAFESEESCWRFLDRKTPEELVGIFSTSDPLRITERCGRYLWHEGLLLEVDRVVEHAIHHVAFRTARRPDNTSVEEWLLACISESTESVLRKDEEMLKLAENEAVEAWAPAHAFIRGAFELEEFHALRVCAAFNGMLPRERKAFFALCMEKRSVEDCLESGFGPPEWLRKTCMRGLDLILGLVQPGSGEPCDDEGVSDEQ